MTPQEIVDKIDSPEIPFEVYYTINEFLDNNNENDAFIYKNISNARKMLQERH